MNETSKTTANSGTKPRLVFFGNERIATAVTTTCPTLTKLIADGYDIAAVVVNEQSTGPSRKKRPLEIADIAAHHGIPLLNPEKPGDILTNLAEFQADAVVLVAYGRIIPQEVIDVFPGGIVNIHPSLLPRHRGSTPIESVILEGESTTGVSLMRLAREMDAGDVYAYTEVALDSRETKQNLADRLLEVGSEMILVTLDRIISGEISGQPQDEHSATYNALITKQDGFIDLSKPAIQLEREVRAYLGWPGSRMEIAGKDVVITATHVAPNSFENVDKKTIFVANKQLCLQTADGILVIDELKPAGRPAMPATAFLAGYAHKI